MRRCSLAVMLLLAAGCQGSTGQAGSGGGSAGTGGAGGSGGTGGGAPSCDSAPHHYCGLESEEICGSAGCTCTQLRACTASCRPGAPAIARVLLLEQVVGYTLRAQALPGGDVAVLGNTSADLTLASTHLASGTWFLARFSPAGDARWATSLDGVATQTVELTGTAGGKLILTPGDGRVLIRGPDGEPAGEQNLPDGTARVLAASDDGILIGSGQPGAVTLTLAPLGGGSGPSVTRNDAVIAAVGLPGKRFAVLSQAVRDPILDSAITVYGPALDPGKPIARPGEDVVAVAAAADGGLVASGYRRYQVVGTSAIPLGEAFVSWFSASGDFRFARSAGDVVNHLLAMDEGGDVLLSGNYGPGDSFDGIPLDRRDNLDVFAAWYSPCGDLLGLLTAGSDSADGIWSVAVSGQGTFLPMSVRGAFDVAPGQSSTPATDFASVLLFLGPPG